MFGPFQLNVDTESLGQMISMLQEPRREVVSLVVPGSPHIKFLEPSELHHISSRLQLIVPRRWTATLGVTAHVYVGIHDVLLPRQRTRLVEAASRGS